MKILLPIFMGILLLNSGIHAQETSLIEVRNNNISVGLEIHAIENLVLWSLLGISCLYFVHFNGVEPTVILTVTGMETHTCDEFKVAEFKGCIVTKMTT